MEIILIVMIWELSLVFAFWLGTKFKKRKSVSPEREITEKERKALDRIQKEQQNFMTYDGTPQEAINDFE